MLTLEEIKCAISALSKEDYIHLRKWFSEKDWEQWNKEIEKDSASGKLGFLMEEAVAEKNRDGSANFRCTKRRAVSGPVWKLFRKK